MLFEIMLENLGLCNYFNFLFIQNFIVFLFSFTLSFVGLKYLIKYFQNKNEYQPIRSDGPSTHIQTKSKTPTMGGLVLSFAIIISTLLFADLYDTYIWAILIISTIFAMTGFIDDIIKVFYHNTNGFKGSIKLIIQMLVCSGVIIWLLLTNPNILNNYNIFIPFFHINIYIGIIFIPFVLIIITGSANAVNLTDGLDGLVIVPVMFCALLFNIISFYTYQTISNDLFYTPAQLDLTQLSVICSAIIGSGLAFFIYNKHPAKIFMGDVGSLMYGSLLGCMAIFLKQELFYAIIGLLFVIEALSVILQVSSYKIFKKRIFKMSPLHHHLEQSGLTEKKVVYLFWLFSIICGIIGILGIIRY